ncbi:MAG: hypothetical protein A2469_04570 [Candidatus Magasanikbacteria bacterium RIFOXYC2_FULL_40_16]|uniref:PsbP C-terminal domain-containing protein n=3 Tax=Candidatus Magasanikiibacteriota TaxID=1752731 RepID=A0A1F6NGW1_9BACT|nr:MAG: hypothetical protein A2224_02435 [Candidatus Magasanikbacteria bacterium RIFOXYA2_FULL_40_20]OGH83177.1 MAG: hypothetical protein A2373_04525 [Candidatus Magasanikbacteria bacterium RIFOXYB1_FULL_40_15]OGH86659.1 MAG: hypothetical protein A2301_00615 [Candidatus Magasanikbacteria bacterium RIFOXYB2_FULL_40_13]OGH87862.1 MAG: hypothetical protein A2206_01845 [Candidatus Magasanikbacteria bacterium RIFOXYA1_FULL_40_8]OGH89443.1 MAG: hypothetical protein A2469_04570 [Candidatus Magasanikba
MKKQHSIVSIFILIIIVLLSVVAASIFVYSKIKPNTKTTETEQKPEKEDSMEEQMVSTIIEGEEYNTYRNEEYGFEFQFPKDWSIKEEVSGNYYSKITVFSSPGTIASTLSPAILVNVVLPEFADNTFNSLNKISSSIEVDGVKGIKYEYEYGGVPEIATVVSLSKYKIILGTIGVRTINNKLDFHEKEYYNFLNSFKFLR